MRHRAALIGALLGLGLGFLLAPGAAGAGVQPLTNSITITKVVVGTPPPGTTFQIGFGCNNGDGTSDGGAFTYDAGGGTQTADIAATLQNCNVTEDTNGGAASTTYDGSSASATVTPHTTSIDVVFSRSFKGSQSATVTVTNTFPEAPPPPPPAAEPAAAARVTPAFTG